MTVINGKYREYELANGLRVALQETPTQTVSAQLCVWNGALNEKLGEEGLAHFLEHCLVTGGSNKFSPLDGDKIKGQFGSYNAFTSLDRTVFEGDMLAEDLPLYLDFVSDVALRPRIDQEKMNEERQRVLREISDAKSNPTFEVKKEFQEAFFGKGSPFTYSVLGKEQVVANVTQEGMKNFHSRGYNPSNMDLIVVGALPDNIEDIVERSFGNSPSGEETRIVLPRHPPLVGSQIIHRGAPENLNRDNPAESSAQMAMLLYAPAFGEDGCYATGMLTQILGGSGNSRLFKEVSQRKGLAYGVGASHTSGTNEGFISLYGQFPSSRMNEAIEGIALEMKKLRDSPVSTDEIEREKRNARYSLAKNFETNDGHVAAILKSWEHGLTPERHMEMIDAITPQDVLEAARKYLPENLESGKYVLLIRDPLKKD